MGVSRTIGLLASALLVAGLGSASSALSAGPDAVSEFHLTDPAGDAYSWSRKPGTGHDVDLVAADVWRRADEVELRLTYDDLVPPRNREWGFAFWIHRPHRPKFFVQWRESQSHGEHHRYGSISKVGEDQEQWIDCPGLHARRSYRSDVLTFWLPSACFGDRPSIVISGLSTDVNVWDRSDEDGEDSPFADGSVPLDSETPPLVAPS